MLKKDTQLPAQVQAQERRLYKRLDHIFPVEFRFLDAAGQSVSGWYQAFTQDVSKGGLCLTVNHLEFGDVKYLVDKNISLMLHINIPLGSEAVKAQAKVAWFKTTRDEPTLQYAIGVSYDTIDPKGNERILRYIGTRRFFKALAITFSIFLSAGLVVAGFYSAKLRYENEKLLMSLSQNLTARRSLERGSLSLKSQIEEMKFLLSQGERKIEILQRNLLETSQDDQKTVGQLQGSIELFKRYQDKMKKELTGLETQKAKVDTDATTKVQEASLLEKKISNKLYRWLAVHQNTSTGLVASFEGDKDISDWGFTYDQSLAAMVFTKAGDLENARRILDFYLRAPKDNPGGFANAYYASTGDVAEFTAHAGPNIWLGLAILQYTHTTGDTRYLDMARGIGNWLETIKDQEGGLRGGKDFSWYSTEHNLDAYAFYTMLYQLTREAAWDKRADETLNWLNKNAYSKLANPVVKRGKGDATIATDTYAWSVTAVGPEKLKSTGMDPDDIMDFALNNCSVAVEYRRPEGSIIKVKGFDFAKHQNLARGGVISCEWTGQMILALKIMADYHRLQGDQEKAGTYARLAYEYVSELSKMIITSPSPVGQGEFCLPYASLEFADTGHGWRTPKGDRTGSVAATAYAILAIDDFNPLRFSDARKPS